MPNPIEIPNRPCDREWPNTDERGNPTFTREWDVVDDGGPAIVQAWFSEGGDLLGAVLISAATEALGDVPMMTG